MLKYLKLLFALICINDMLNGLIHNLITVAPILINFVCKWGGKMPSLTWWTLFSYLTTIKYVLGQNSTKFKICI